MARPSGGSGRRDFSQVPQPNPESARQPVAFFTEPKGIDRYHSSSRVSPQYATNIRNFMFDDGVLISRRGTNLMGGEAPSTVMQVVDFIRKGQKKVTVRFCIRHIQIFEYGLGGWRTFPVALTGSDRDFFSYTGWADKLLFSNGVDGIWEIDFKTLVIQAIPNSPSAKHLTTFGNRVVASSVNFRGEDYPLRVWWTAKNLYKNWLSSQEVPTLTSDLAGGYEDLYGSPGGVTDEAMGVFPSDDTRAWLVRSRSVYQMAVSGNALAPFRFDRTLADIGSPFRNTIVSGPAGIFFVSRENIHSLDGTGHKLIGDAVIDEITEEVESLRPAYGAFDVGRLEYRLACNDLVWRYRIREEGWTTDEYPWEIKSLSRQVQGVAGIPIDNLPGIIDELSIRFPPGAINDLVYRREDDDAMMFVPVDSLLTIREDDSTQDVLLTGDRTDAQLLLDTGILSSEILKATELHELHLEYTSEAEQDLFFEATFDDGDSFQPLSGPKSIEVTQGSEILYSKVERVSRKLQVRLRSQVLGKLRVLGLVPTIVTVERSMAPKKPKVAAISILPSPLNLQVGGTQQLSITLLGAGGQIITGKRVTLLSTNNSIATVSASGLVRAIAPGSFAIVASVGTIQISITGQVTAVTPAAVVTVTITPAISQGAVGTTQQFTATVRDGNGNILLGRVVAWSSSSPAIASVDQTGLVTLLVAGSTAISAICEGVTGGAMLTVTPASATVVTVTVTPGTFTGEVGDTVQLVAEPKDGSSNVLSGKTITWSSSNPVHASVSASGLVTLLAAGSVTITATCETIQGTSSITINTATVAVATVTVTPSSFTKAPGLTQALTATVKDGSGNVLVGRTIVWTSSNNSVAVVDSSGVVTTVSTGNAVITATCEGKTGTCSVVVSQVPVATVTISPSTFDVDLQTAVQLTATVKDIDGNVLVGRTVTWGTADASIATVSSTGLVTGHSVASTTITASCEGQQGTATANVVQGTVTGPTSVALTFSRLLAGTESTLVAIPCVFPPALVPTVGDLARVKIFISGVEKNIAIQALDGLHPDGSLRAARAICIHTLTNGVWVAGEMRVGELRGTADIAMVPVSAMSRFLFDESRDGTGAYVGITTTQREAPTGWGFPDGVGLPSSAAYLISCNLVDPTVTSADATALGGAYAALETQISSYSDQYWTAFGTNTYSTYGTASPSQVDWTLLHNQYDRAFEHYVMWVRTADPKYFQRACAYTWFFQAIYGRKGQEGQFNEHFQGPEGAMLHYWTTGDPLSKEYVVQAATRRYELWMQIQSAGRRLGERGTEAAPAEDPRITGQVINLCRCAWELGDTSQSWAVRLRDLLDRVDGVNLSLGASPARRTTVTPASYTGSWIIGADTPQNCSISTNFMLGFLGRAITRYKERFESDSRIDGIVQGFADFLKTQYRDPANASYMVGGVTLGPTAFPGETSKSYNYLSANSCPSEGGAGISVDLNDMFCGLYAYVAKALGIGGAGAPYLATAEELFATLSLAHNGTDGPTLNDSTTNLQLGKQYNEWMFDYHRFLKYRLG